jgi:hypothetical protein
LKTANGVNEQLFRLNGETWDLEELAIAFPKGSVTVKKIGDFFYLGVEMESGQSDEEIRSSGENALNRMNAICLVRDERFRPPTIAGVTYRDPVTGEIGGTIINARCNMQVGFGMRATAIVLEADGTVRPPQATFGESAFRLCSTNEALRETLRTYGTVERDWRGLYTVFESIEVANNGNIPPSWASRREITDFTCTANSYHAVGPAARHGFGASEVVEARMTLSQARALIQKLLQAWIDELIAADTGKSA